VRDEETEDGRKRRRNPRAAVVLQLQYRNAGHLLVSYCTNLSRGGLFVPTLEPLPAGTQLTLELSIPGETEPAELQAEVRWVRHFDAAEGPAGMGLRFEDVDGVLGDRIDGIVAEFTPLQIHIVGNQPAVRAHVAAQLRSLVSCETTEHEVDPRLAGVFADADLVVIDIDSAPDDALTLLAGLSRLRPPPPRVALCDARDVSRRSRAQRLARVVPTPVDVEQLRTCVLETVTQVFGHRTDD
jgi:uncharacterized protein (TIGR02266 family)